MLKDAENSVKENGKFSDEMLQGLHDVFGEVFVKATEILESGVVIRYETPNGVRVLFKVTNKKETYTLFDNINFCYCSMFAQEVLVNQNLLTCKHVLAVRLAEISDQVEVNKLTDLQYVDFVRDVVNYIKE